MDFDFRAAIELVKYTLALTAACFVYCLEKLSPHTTPGGPWVVCGLLAIFAVAACFGIIIFSAYTAGLHDAKRAPRPRIKRVATAHVVLLLLGIVFLSLLLGHRIFTEPPKPPQMCCEQTPTNAAR